jgi:hypothetical protein
MQTFALTNGAMVVQYGYCRVEPVSFCSKDANNLCEIHAVTSVPIALYSCAVGTRTRLYRIGSCAVLRWEKPQDPIQDAPSQIFRYFRTFFHACKGPLRAERRIRSFCMDRSRLCYHQYHPDIPRLCISFCSICNTLIAGSPWPDLLAWVEQLHIYRVHGEP